MLPLLTSPSYSPRALRHLPQPVPNDLAPGMDPASFTFDDAFEDLLAVSQGQPLPEIDARYQQSRLLRRMFPAGEPTWFWMRRLESQRLLPSRDPFSLIVSPEWGSFHRTVDWSELWRAAAPILDPEPLDQPARASKPSDPSSHKDGAQSEPPISPEPQHRRAAPDFFDELFSSLSSVFAESQRSWEVFLNTIMGPAATSDKHHVPSHAARDAKHVETRDEYVDGSGYLHSSVTRQTLDEHGNEIGRETYVTVRPATSKTSNDREPNEKDCVKSDVESSTNKPGWFWK